MKILFYNHTGKVSGAERMLLTILERLDRASFDPVVLCPADGPLQTMTTALGIRTRTLDVLRARFTWRPDRLFRSLKSFVGVITELRRAVIRADPDLIHANSIRAGLVATAATLDLKTPVVWHLHDLLPRHPLSSAIRLFAALSGRARMIAVSEAVAENFCGHLSIRLKDRVTVILNAIDLSKFTADPTARERIRRELKLNGATPVVGIVGQLTPRKGQLELIRAFAQSLPEMSHAMLLIVGAPLFNGDHEYEAELKQEIQALSLGDHVRLMGPRNDIGSVMQSLDLLAINSAAEPFGLVAVEGMACGTPVLAAAVDGLPEIIRHGENGWLVPRLNQQLLSKALINLAQEPQLRERLAERGKQDVRARFSVDRYIEELERFYREDGETKTDREKPFILQLSREIGLRGGSESVSYQLHRAWLGKGIDSRALVSTATEPESRRGITFTLRRLTRLVSPWPHLHALFVVPIYTMVASWRASRMERMKIVLSHGDSFTGDVCIVHALNSASVAEKRRNGYWSWAFNPSNVWFAFRDRWMLGGRRYRRIVAISEGVRRELKERYGVPDEQIAMIPNGIDLSRFSAENINKKAEVRRSLKIDEHVPLILFVGSQYRLKGLEFVIKALALVKTEAVLLVVGADDPAPYIRLTQQMKLEDRVIFAGARHDLPQIYPAADAFVLPTLYETFALVCLEAMASGLPVLATAVGGIEDYLRDGENGLQIQRNEIDIAAKLDRLFNDEDLYRRLRENGLATVQAYAWEHIAEKYLKLFNEVIAEKLIEISGHAPLRAQAFEI